MGLPTVNKFLCCCELETGGFVLGWLVAIFSGLGILGLGGALILILVDFDSFSQEMEIGGGTTTAVIAVIFAIGLLYLCGYFIAAVQLIRGTRNKNHVQMKLYLVLTGIGCFVSFLQIFTFGISAIVSSIIGFIIAAYFFVCIYSLYQKVKKGRLNAGSAFNQHPTHPSMIYSTQPMNNQGAVYNQSQANHPGMIYNTQSMSNQGAVYNHSQANHPGMMYGHNIANAPSHPGFVNTLNPQNSGVVVSTPGKF